MIWGVVRVAVVGTLASLLSACGGGGGGGGRDDGGNGGGFRVTPDRTSVSFNYVQGAHPGSQTVGATWTGTPPDPLFVGALLQGAGLSQVMPITITQDRASIELSPLAHLSAGQYTGVVQVLVCSDQACNQRVGGTPISISYTINVRAPVYTGPANIELSYTRFTTTAPTTATLSIGASGGAWTASTDSSRVTLSQASGAGAAELIVSFNPAAFTAGGVYVDRVTVTNGTDTQSSLVTMNVLQPTFTVAPFIFSGVNGSTFEPQGASVTVSVFGPVPGSGQVDVPMMASTATPWLAIDSASASASPGAPGALNVSVDPSIGPLASGEHGGSIRLQMGTPGDNTVVDVPLTLLLTRATLTVTPATLELGGERGRTFDSASVGLWLDTDSRAYAWSVSARPSWLSASQTSGNVNAGGQPITFTPQRLESTPGTATTDLTFTTLINGDVVTATLPVAFHLDQHRLIASENGVALVDLPGTTSWDRLTHTVSVSDNFGLDTEWTATSDQPWLQLSENGDQLTLTANPADLDVDTLSIATITIEADSDPTAAPERIRVGLWVGATTPTGRVQQSAVTSFFETAAADPIRPYVYAYELDAPAIRVFNTYTGAELAPITGVPQGGGVLLRHLVASSDGDALYIYNISTCRLIPIDLNTGVVGASLESCENPNVSVARTQFAYARPNGVGVLLNDNGEAMLASTGRPLGNGVFGPFAVSGDSKRVFALNTNLIDFTSARGGEFVRTAGGAIEGFAERRQASNFDGSRVYALDNVSTSPELADPNRLRAANGLTGAALADVSTGLVYERLAVSRQGRLFYTAENNFRAHDANGAELMPPLLIGTERGPVLATGDGRFGVAVSLTPDSSVHIVPVAP